MSRAEDRIRQAPVEEVSPNGDGPAPSGLRLYTPAELFEVPDPKWLIEPFVVEGCMSMLFGPSGTFKSFVALDWARAPGLAVYMSAESSPKKLGERIAAWEHAAGRSCGSGQAGDAEDVQLDRVTTPRVTQEQSLCDGGSVGHAHVDGDPVFVWRVAGTCLVVDRRCHTDCDRPCARRIHAQNDVVALPRRVGRRPVKRLGLSAAPPSGSLSRR